MSTNHSPPVLMPQAQMFLAFAKHSYEQVRSNSSIGREHVGCQAIACILFAALAAEGFINELAELAAEYAKTTEPSFAEPPEIARLAKLLRTVEAGNGSVTLKYDIMRIAIAGEAFDQSCEPYQGLAHLFKVRNHLAHLKLESVKSWRPDDVRDSRRKVGKGFKETDVVDFPSNVGWFASELYQISTPNCAKRACDSASRIIRDTIELLPISRLKETMGLFWIDTHIAQEIT